MKWKKNETGIQKKYECFYLNKESKSTKTTTNIEKMYEALINVGETNKNEILNCINVGTNREKWKKYFYTFTM